MLRTDNGLEYFREEFNKHFEQCGIRQEKSCLLTPEQNSGAERMNCILAEMARCLLLEANLPHINCRIKILEKLS